MIMLFSAFTATATVRAQPLTHASCQRQGIFVQVAQAFGDGSSSQMRSWPANAANWTRRVFRPARRVSLPVISSSLFRSCSCRLGSGKLRLLRCFESHRDYLTLHYCQSSRLFQHQLRNAHRLICLSTDCLVHQSPPCSPHAPFPEP